MKFNFTKTFLILFGINAVLGFMFDVIAAHGALEPGGGLARALAGFVMIIPIGIIFDLTAWLRDRARSKRANDPVA